MTTLLPLFIAVAGKVNFWSFSSMLLRLLVELERWSKEERIQVYVIAYFPNDVPKNTLFNHTLAAKAKKMFVSEPNDM